MQIVVHAGHSNPVSTLKSTGDGRLLVTSDGGFAKVWDLTNNRQLLSLPGAGTDHPAAAISRDGRTLATLDMRKASGAGLDAPMQIHVVCRFLPTGAELSCFSPNSTNVRALALDPSGTQVASASGLTKKGEKALEVHDVKTGSLIYSNDNATLIHHPGGVAFSSDGTKVLVFGTGETRDIDKNLDHVEITDLRTKQVLGVGIPFITSAVFNNVGNKVVVSSHMGGVSVIDITDIQQVRRIDSLGAPCLTLTDEKAVEQEYSTEISKLRKAMKVPAHCKHELAMPDESYNLDGMEDLKVSDDDRSVYALAFDGSVETWSLETRQSVSRTKPTLATVEDLRKVQKISLSEDGTFVFQGFESGAVRVYRADARPVIVPPESSEEPVLLGGGSVIVLPNRQGTFEVFRAANNYQAELLRLPTGYQNLQLQLSPDGRYLISDAFLSFDSSDQMLIKDAGRDKPKKDGEFLDFPRDDESLDTAAFYVWDLFTSELSLKLPQSETIVASDPAKGIYLTEYKGTWSHKELTLTRKAQQTTLADTEGFQQPGLDREASMLSYVTMDKRKLKTMALPHGTAESIDLPTPAKSVVFGPERIWAIVSGQDDKILLADLKHHVTHALPNASVTAPPLLDSAEQYVWQLSAGTLSRIDLATMLETKVIAGDDSYDNVRFTSDGQYVIAEGKTRTGRIVSRIDKKTLQINRVNLGKDDFVAAESANASRMVVVPGWAHDRGARFTPPAGQRSIAIYELGQGRMTATLPPLDVSGVDCDPAGERVAVRGPQNALYDASSGQFLGALDSYGYDSVFTADHRILSTDRGHLYILSSDNGQRLGVLESATDTDWLVSTPDGLFDGTPRS